MSETSDNNFQYELLFIGSFLFSVVINIQWENIILDGRSFHVVLYLYYYNKK